MALHRHKHPAADRWAAGHGPIQHTIETQAQVILMVEALAIRDVRGDEVPPTFLDGQAAPHGVII